jgi:hypothetical protein
VLLIVDLWASCRRGLARHLSRRHDVKLLPGRRGVEICSVA